MLQLVVNKIYPDKLQKGDEIRVIAPARSLAILGSELKMIANERIESLGFKLTFGKNVAEIDDFGSSTIESRINDLHDAFADKKVKAILTVLGGFNSNQLLSSIDWELIKQNPKILGGYSDITALNNAIYAKTGLVTYSGPHYSSFGQKLYFDYTLDYFSKCLFKSEPYALLPSPEWSDDSWYKDQENRQLIKNEGYWIIHPGKAEGTILGANLTTFGLLQGTNYFPDLNKSILFLEDDDTINAVRFDSELQSLTLQANFNKVGGIVIGRFQNKSEVTKDLLVKIIKSKKELEAIPIVANVDFGHTDPKITYPIGGMACLDISEDKARLTILEH